MRGGVRVLVDAPTMPVQPRARHSFTVSGGVPRAVPPIAVALAALGYASRRLIRTVAIANVATSQTSATTSAAAGVSRSVTGRTLKSDAPIPPGRNLAMSSFYGLGSAWARSGSTRTAPTRVAMAPAVRRTIVPIARPSSPTNVR